MLHSNSFILRRISATAMPLVAIRDCIGGSIKVGYITKRGSTINNERGGIRSQVMGICSSLADWIKRLISLSLIAAALLLVGCGGGGGSGSAGSGGTDNRSGDSGIVDGDGNGNNGDGNGGDNRSGDNGIIGDDNRSGDGGIIDGDGNGGELNIPAQAEWIIMPLAGGLSIQWHNLHNFTQMNAPQRLSINLTRSDTSMKQTHTINVSDFINGIYQLTGLEDGIAYKFASMIELEYGGNISHSRPISLLLEFNRLDNIGNGIVVGVDNDRDGRANSVDEDDDNDMVLDEDEAHPRCVLDEDCDGDGEPDIVDIDDDGDGLIEIGTAAELDAVRWVLDGTGFKANETAMLDQTGCGDGVDITVCNGYELVRNIFLTDYIADNYPMVGWKPIAPDVNPGGTDCDGDKFTSIFDGNGFEVRGLFINRSMENCIGLFGRANGRIRNLGVVVDRIVGGRYVGSLVGDSNNIFIMHSYAVNSEVRGGDLAIGGLVGRDDFSLIVQSYGVSGVIRGSDTAIGGLIGAGSTTRIIQSYAVVSEIRGSNLVGGLTGTNSPATTTGPQPAFIHSYAVTGTFNTTFDNFLGGISGFGGEGNSYWDNQISGRNSDGATGNSGQTTSALRSPTDYIDIYDTWEDGTMVDGINDNATIWCDEDQSGVIEDDERRGKDHAMGDNRVWHFGTATDYPALRCTGNLTDQRAWWHLNATHKPQLNTTRLNAYLDGSLP